MQTRMNNLQKENEDIRAQIDPDNRLLQSYDSQFESYRKKYLNSKIAVNLVPQDYMDLLFFRPLRSFKLYNQIQHF
jgi:hypothetical protein